MYKEISRTTVLIFTGLLVQASCSAAEWSGNNQYQQEQRMLREYAQQQQGWQAPQQNARQQAYRNRAVPAQPVPVAKDLFGAAKSGNVAQLRRLLSQGIDVNVSNRERETALHMAAANGHYSTVIFLVKNGAWIKAPTIKNWLPLHHAVRFRHANIANFLVQRGASPHVRTSDGMSAIRMARNIKDYQMLSILGAR